jgi:hypothetical protein
MGSHAEKTVRVIRVAIVGSEGDWPAEKKRLAAVAQQIQQATNDWAAHWLRLHYAAGNHLAVRQWMAADTAWVKTPKAEREPKVRVPCPVKPCDAAMSREIYAALRVDHFALGTKPVGLATQKAMKRLTQSSATKSAYPRWMIILAGRGEFPQSARSLPIPFYTSNCKLVLPDPDAKLEEWRLEVRLEQAAGEKKGLVPIRLKLKTGGRGCESIRKALWQIAKGEWKFSASDLVCRDGLWYAHICYQMPKAELPPLDAGRTAFLSAGAKCPVLLRMDGRTWKRLRRGNDVRHVRRQLTVQRFGKSESYRYASRAKKGHGRGVALAWREKLARRWRDFVKTWNGQLAAEVAKRLRAAGIGRLVVYQPADAWRDTRYLTTAGKVPGRVDSTGWDWYQMQSQIDRICQENGIEVLVKKVGERRFRGKKSTEAATV